MNVRLEPAPVRGFRFAGVCAGLRNEPGRKDLGVIAADWPVAAAGVFTTNRVKAAPVMIARAHQARTSAGDRGQFRIGQLLYRQGRPQARS